MSQVPTQKIKRQDMLSIFEEMGRLCREAGVQHEIAIYGGSALMLAFDYREATVDIDFIPVSGAAPEIKRIANLATARLGLEANILRDDVSIFVSDAADYKISGEFPRLGPDEKRYTGGLRVFSATPEYIFAMKILAMRNAVETQDFKDIWELADACGVGNLESACKLLARFYPEKQLPQRNRLLLEDIFEAKQQRKPFSPALGW